MRNSEDAPSPYVIPYVCMYTNWMVVSNMFIFHPYLLKWSNLTRMFFRWVVQPPTSIYTFIYLEPFADPAVTDWKRLVFWGVGWPSKIEVIGALHFGVNVFCPKKKVQGIPSAPWDCTISSTRNCRSHPLNSQVMLLNDSEYDMNIYTYHIYIHIMHLCRGSLWFIKSSVVFSRNNHSNWVFWLLGVSNGVLMNVMATALVVYRSRKCRSPLKNQPLRHGLFRKKMGQSWFGWFKGVLGGGFKYFC